MTVCNWQVVILVWVLEIRVENVVLVSRERSFGSRLNPLVGIKLPRKSEERRCQGYNSRTPTFRMPEPVQWLTEKNEEINLNTDSLVCFQLHR